MIGSFLAFLIFVSSVTATPGFVPVVVPMEIPDTCVNKAYLEGVARGAGIVRVIDTVNHAANNAPYLAGVAKGHK